MRCMKNLMSRLIILKKSDGDYTSSDFFAKGCNFDIFLNYSTIVLH